MNNNQIDMKVTEIRNIQAEIAALTEKLNSVKDELKKELDTRKVDSVETALHKVFYLAFEKKLVDNQKLKDDGLYEDYCKPTVQIQFKITDKKIEA